MPRSALFKLMQIGSGAVWRTLSGKPASVLSGSNSEALTASWSNRVAIRVHVLVVIFIIFLFLITTLRPTVPTHSPLAFPTRTRTLPRTMSRSLMSGPLSLRLRQPSCSLLGRRKR